ncbi:acyl-CoA thioesterase [Roseospirillum parvum]|uniref:Acyl-CoA thioesterase YciA n=1 Tax=Roseospirillum parvum TaxID=83401 RepID=A0A1G8D3W2_9PROT|nr:acyl-CoA thioesterase [Roseospirillum parvum]SDH52214.1 acyl-CoA thioesterase YciA [Roseospirillum parvum]
MTTDDAPHGTLALRTIAMPADTNPAGDIFGGWLLGQMDLAGGTHARHHSRGRVATVAVDSMTFHKPVYVGDELSCYADMKRVGRSSMTVLVEAWVRRDSGQTTLKVTEGVFTFVAIDGEGRPRPAQPADP